MSEGTFVENVPFLKRLAPAGGGRCSVTKSTFDTSAGAAKLKDLPTRFCAVASSSVFRRLRVALARVPRISEISEPCPP